LAHQMECILQLPVFRSVVNFSWGTFYFREVLVRNVIAKGGYILVVRELANGNNALIFLIFWETGIGENFV